MLLKINGWKGSFSSIENELASRVDGNSLLELQRASRALGLEAVIEKRLGNSGLRDICPAIIFLKASKDAPSTEFGHYAVLVDADPNKATLIDGTTAERQLVSWEWLRNASSGHLVRIKEQQYLSISAVSQGVVVALLISCALYFVVKLRRRRWQPNARQVARGIL